MLYHIPLSFDNTPKFIKLYLSGRQPQKVLAYLTQITRAMYVSDKIVTLQVRMRFSGEDLTLNGNCQTVFDVS